MSQTAHDPLREIREAEDECGDINIGVGVDQFFASLKRGRIHLDLHSIPEDQRLRVYREVVELVRQRGRELRNGSAATPGPTGTVG
jgi:hypothetical protein